VGLAVSTLPQYDATIQTSAASGAAWVKSVSIATATGYSITTESANGNDTYTITRTNGDPQPQADAFHRLHGGCNSGTW